MKIATVEKLPPLRCRSTTSRSQYTTISFKLTKEESKIVEEAAKRLGITKSELIKRALSEYLKQNNLGVLSNEL